jgi:hypothetical protein
VDHVARGGHARGDDRVAVGAHGRVGASATTRLDAAATAHGRCPCRADPALTMSPNTRLPCWSRARDACRAVRLPDGSAARRPPEAVRDRGSSHGPRQTHCFVRRTVDFARQLPPMMVAAAYHSHRLPWPRAHTRASQEVRCASDFRSRPTRSS